MGGRRSTRSRRHRPQPRREYRETPCQALLPCARPRGSVPETLVTALRALPLGVQRIADAARGWRGRAGELECPAADGASCGRPALGAAQTRDVTGPDDLEQDGPVLECTSGFLPGEGGDARLGRRGFLGERLATCDDFGGLWAREWHGGEPAHADEARDLEARRVCREDQGHRLALRAQQRDVACARVWGELLGEALVAVVPHEHRAEVRCWGVDDTPRTDDDPGRLVETSEERRVAFGRLGPRVEAPDAC